MVKIHLAIANSLKDLGVDTMFGLMGDSNMLYIVDFQNLPGTRYIGSIEEGAAVSMADGYSRRSGHVGAVTISHGPAATNALTALTEAVRARTPLVLFTSDAPAFPRGHAQRFDLQGLARLAGAGYVRSLRPEDCVESIAIAFRRAAAERLPVVLDIPVDQVRADVEYAPPSFRRHDLEYAPPSFRRHDPDPVAPPAADPDLQRAAAVIAASERPVVVAGLGARRPDARAAVTELADLLGAPLATTLLAKDLFRGHPFDLGIIARIGHSIAARVVSESDCLIVFGSSLDDFMTMDGLLFAGKKVVQVDIDRTQLGRHREVDAAVLGDSGLVAQELVSALTARGVATRCQRTPELEKELAEFDFRGTFHSEPAPGTLDLRTAVICLDETLPRERFVVTDSGRFMWAPWRYLGVQTPGSFAHTMHFGSIGLGLGTAIGAAAADPDRMTVAVSGDVGTMMNLVEFRTAVAHRLPLVLAVLNDSCYGAEYPKFQRFGYDPASSLVQWPDFAEVATALGGEAITIRSVDDFDLLEKAVEAARLPLLLDIKCDPTIDIPVNPDQKIHQAPLAASR